jgi:phytoene synthase
LKTALARLPDLPPDSRAAYLPLALVPAILNGAARADADPFVPRPASRLRILWTLWRASRMSPFRT